jgi:hypothetical protein
MSLLKSLEFIPGIKWFESEMHDTLFQHSVFGAIVFLIVSNTGVYKFVKDTIFQCCGIKVDGNTLQLVHAVVFMVIMYFGSMYLFAPLLGEGYPNGEGPEFVAERLNNTATLNNTNVRTETALNPAATGRLEPLGVLSEAGRQ